MKSRGPVRLPLLTAPAEPRLPEASQRPYREYLQARRQFAAEFSTFLLQYGEVYAAIFGSPLAHFPEREQANEEQRIQSEQERMELIRKFIFLYINLLRMRTRGQMQLTLAEASDERGHLYSRYEVESALSPGLHFGVGSGLLPRLVELKFLRPIKQGDFFRLTPRGTELYGLTSEGSDYDQSVYAAAPNRERYVVPPSMVAPPRSWRCSTAVSGRRLAS